MSGRALISAFLVIAFASACAEQAAAAAISADGAHNTRHLLKIGDFKKPDQPKNKQGADTAAKAFARLEGGRHLLKIGDFKKPDQPKNKQGADTAVKAFARLESNKP